MKLKKRIAHEMNKIKTMSIHGKERRVVDIEEMMEYAYLELGDISKIQLDNPLDVLSSKDKHDVYYAKVVQFLRNPKYLAFFCKHILNVDLPPFQMSVLHQLWTKPFPMLIATRGGSKSFMLALYIACRAILDQGVKICVVGAAMRQSMVLFNYIEAIWNNSPVLQDICGGKKNCPRKSLHMCTWTVGKSEVKFLPLGSGETIRGQRADVIIADEFASIDPNVFETVVRGFAAVKSKGLMESIKYRAKKKMLKDLGLEDAADEKADDRLKISTNLGCNQIVIAGTTTYQFNHFFKYFSYYRAIITSGGDVNYLKQHYPDMSIPKGINSSQYCIMRIPYNLIPAGMMDESILAQGRATMNSSIFDQEYGCVFPTDSDGFYPASMIHACKCPFKSGEDVIDFPAMLAAEGMRTIMGIDPASEKDNFTINIIGLMHGKRCVIYQWSTTRKLFQEQREKKLISSEINDYITFCVKHVRSLLKRFNCESIIMDAGGGGLSIKEGLKDKDKFIDSYDRPVFDVEDENDVGKDGQYILTMINFQDTEWRKAAHHGLRKDLADRKILFPQYDTSAVAMSLVNEDEQNNYENYESLYNELEQLKHEITLIKHDQTNTGQEKWDVPRLKISGHEEISKMLKKDRFTSILLSNWGARMVDSDADMSIKYHLIGSGRGVKPSNDGTVIQYMNKNAKRLRYLSDIENPLSNYSSASRGSVYK